MQPRFKSFKVSFFSDASGGREFHTVLLRVVVYVARCAALRASACMGI